MAYIYLCLAGSFLLISLCTSNSLEDSHVCDRLRLVQVKVTNPKTWNCIEDYPEHICQRIRPSEKLKEIFKVQNESVCCPGWMDDSDELDCKRRCEEGFFGQDCKFKCRCIHGTSQSCYHVDGSCNCSAGMMGRDCNKRCSPGFYGTNCTKQNITCKSGGTNHPSNGNCICSSQFHGPSCETKGAKRLYCRKQDCINGVPKMGTKAEFCMCNNGWRGRCCEIEPCEIGKTGENCGETCCRGRGYCINESCICADGYHGEMCQHKCENGTFGRNCKGNCSCPLGCDHVTGACDECPPGFMGDRCTEYCLSTQWGPTCNQTCSCGEEEICDIFTGTCFQHVVIDKTARPPDIRSTVYPTRLSSPDSVKKHGLLIGCLLPAVLVLVVCGFIVRKRCKKCKKTKRRKQNGQTYFTNVAPSTRSSNTTSGYSTRSDSNFYLTVLGTPTSSHREESSISDEQTYITSVASSTGYSTTSSGYIKPSDGNLRPSSHDTMTHREESVTSDGQTYITSVASSTGYSTTSSGYTKPSDGNPRQVSHGARTYREESVTSDGYTKPSDVNLCQVPHGARTYREESVTSDGYCKPSKVNSYSTAIYSSAKPPSHRAESPLADT